MNAMQLLRGFGSIDPRYLDAALQNSASAAAPQSSTPDAAAKPERMAPAPAQRRPRLLRFAGWGAAAACLLLAAGVFLRIRGNREEPLFTASSQNDEIAEVTVTDEQTDTAAPVTQTDTAPPVSTQTTADALTGHVTAQTVQSGSQSAAPDTEPTRQTTGTFTEPTTESSTATSAVPVTYPASVQVLAANGDMSGTLGSAVQYSQISGADAVQRYLNGTEPVITLGSGQKDADTVQRILRQPEMLRIRWQTDSGCWEEYGIESAVLGRDGVLRITLCMYTSDADAEKTDWIYETALIWDTGALPPVQDVQLELRYYTEGNDPGGGIAQWLAFDSRIMDDIEIEIEQ